MIVGKITAKSQTTIPRAVRAALGLAPGDEVAWEIEDGHVVLRRREPPRDPFDHPFALFTEWADDLDGEAFDGL